VKGNTQWDHPITGLYRYCGVATREVVLLKDKTSPPGGMRSALTRSSITWLRKKRKAGEETLAENMPKKTKDRGSPRPAGANEGGSEVLRQFRKGKGEKQLLKERSITCN